MKKLTAWALAILLTAALTGCSSGADTVRFRDKTFQKSSLSAETVQWLEWYNSLSEAEQLSVSGIPDDLYRLYGFPEGEDAAASGVKELASSLAGVKWAMIPMVMVDGQLYLDTGYESTAARCGVPDGRITSEVSGSEKPEKDDQSNFGSGYDYQFGEEGTVEVCIDGKWWIYATEEKRTELQFPNRAENLQTGDAAGLSPDQIRAFGEILEAGEWCEGTADCLNDCRIVLEGKAYDYHISCGTFNDNEGQRSLTLDEQAKAAMDELLAECLPQAEQ